MPVLGDLQPVSDVETPHMRLLITAARHRVTLSGLDILRLMFLRYRVGTRRIGGPNDGASR